MEDNFKKTGLEQTVVDLLETYSQNGVNQTNMLLMLSLVNLMGIVDILQSSTVVTGANIELQRGEMSQPVNETNKNANLGKLLQQAASGEVDPMQLLALLNQPGGQMPNPAALMGMLSQMMPPPPPPQDKKQPPPSHNQPVRENIKPRSAATPDYKNDEEKGYKENENATTNNKSYLKWDPRLG